MVWSLTKRAVRRLRRGSSPSPVVPLSVESLAAFLDQTFPSDPSELTDRLVRELPRWVRGVWTVRGIEYEDLLFARVPALVAPVDAQRWMSSAPSWLKVAVRHLQHQDREGLHDFLTRGGLDLKRHGGSVTELGPVVHLPGWDDLAIDRSCFVLAEQETALAATVRRARWDGDDLVLVVNAGLRHIEAPTGSATAKAWWGDEELPVAPAGETFGHRHDEWNETMDACHWQLRLPGRLLGVPNHLRMDVQIAGRTAGGSVTSVDPISSAMLLPPHLIDGQWRGMGDGALLGPVDAPAPGVGAQIVAWRLESDAIVVEGSGSAVVAELVSARGRIPAVSVTSDQQRFTARFPVDQDRWGRGSTPLPIGDHVVEVDGRAVTAEPALIATVPQDMQSGLLSAHTIVTEGTVGLRLVKPRGTLENTMYGQRRLRREYRGIEEPVDPDMALFQCFWAEVATDSQLAIFHELRRRRPSMALHWGVVDHSVAVPEGAIPVIAGSQEWYEVLARAAYLVKNTEVGDYTRLRPGQCYVQTFHGQPFKRMGAAFWRDTKQWPEFRVRWEARDRRSSFWSLIVTPDPEANHWYRDNYFYDGRILDQGLPRTDSLLAPDAAERRERTRVALGIEPGQTAVLHATTWRENQSQGNNTARDPGFLDVADLAAELGPGHVVLQRSHHAVARSAAPRLAETGVIDVTDHPDINDLVLASDIAILDYSSLRFEVGLAGVPMVFFVPDLEAYTSDLRGFLFDFEESAPGPLVTDAAELTDLVRHPEVLRAEFAGSIDAFNQRFNAHHDGHAAARVVDAMLDEESM